MFNQPWAVALGVLLGLVWSAGATDGAAPDAAKVPAVTIHFERGAWDATRWTPVRLANQPEPKPLTQGDHSIGTTTTTFTEQDYGREVDNAVLIHDLGTSEAQVDVEFTIGKGFHGTSAPGLCISPRIEGGVVVSSIAVFVADYTMAVWYQDTGKDGKTVQYRHLFQIARWSDPAKPHVLRCRISKREASLAFQVDDSDVVALTFVGNPNLSFIPQQLNSIVGLWGCHGECGFESMTISQPGTLPFLVRQKPAGR